MPLIHKNTIMLILAINKKLPFSRPCVFSHQIFRQNFVENLRREIVRAGHRGLDVLGQVVPVFFPAKQLFKVRMVSEGQAL